MLISTSRYVCNRSYNSPLHNDTKNTQEEQEQSLIPSWILNQDAYQEAINKNVQLMRTAKSEKVQAMAADSLLKHLAKPEVNDTPLINIDMRQGSGLDELKEAITSLAKKQKELIEGGVSTKEIAEQKLYVEEER